MSNTGKAIQCGKLAGKVDIPASKSLTHRYYLLAALSRKPVTVFSPLRSEDTDITLASIKAIGYEVANHGDHVHFSGNWQAPGHTVKMAVSNAGTSARLLTAFSAIHPVTTLLDGSPRMRERPMGHLIEALQLLGVEIEHQKGYLPLTIHGQHIRKTSTTIDASMSSQFLSALLMIGPACQNGLQVKHYGRIASRPYVDITAALMAKAGIQIESDADSHNVPPGQSYTLPDAQVEGDYSSASYFLCAAAITGRTVTLGNLRRDSVQGDRVILDILSKAGSTIDWQDDTVTIHGNSLKGMDHDMNNSPDLVPAVSVAALFADGPSRFRNVGHLRFKETDRLAAIIGNITRLGGKARSEGEDLIIEPHQLHGAVLHAYNDHRMAMAFSLAGLKVPGVFIDDPACVAKSYPQYWNHFDDLHQR